MAYITHDCVLMPHMLPARSVDPAGAFFVLRDRNNEPMIFSIGNNGILYLSYRGTTGNYELVDLSKKFGIGDPNHVLTLSVTQSRDLSLYIVFAVGRPGSESSIRVVKPGKPWQFDWAGEGTLKSHLYQGETTSMVVDKILVVSL